MSRLKKLAGNAGALALGGIVAQGAFVGVEALVARLLGPSGYGVYSSSYVLVMVMFHLTDMGMYWKLVQDGARDPKTISANIGGMMLARILLFTLIYPVILLILWGWRDDPIAARFFALFGWFGLQFAFQELLSSVYTARQQMARSAIFQALLPVSILASVAILVVPEPTLFRLALAFVLGAAPITVIWTWLVVRRERPRLRIGAVLPTLRSCFHYGVSGLAWNIYLRTGTLVLAFTSGHEEVAFFAAAYRLIDLFFKVSVLANRVVAPRLYADSTSNHDAFVRTADMLLRLTIGASALGALSLFVSGDWIVALVYGAGFAASGDVLQILGISLTLKTIALIVQTIISAAEEQRYRMKIVTGSTVLSIAIAIPAGIEWGATGVAFAVVAADIVILALLFWRVVVTRSLPSVMAVFAVPLIAGIGIAAAVVHLHVNVVIEGLLACVIFVIALLVTGYLRPVMTLVRGGTRHAMNP